MPGWVWLAGSVVMMFVLAWHGRKPHYGHHYRQQPRLKWHSQPHTLERRPAVVSARDADMARRLVMPSQVSGEPRLTIELVPKTCWFSNVRSQVSPEDWDRIRKPVYRAAGHRCEICGGRGPKHPVECHEVWAYDDGNLVQTLVRMIALCPDCHGVKHMGFSTHEGRGDTTLQHLANVNGWHPLTVSRYVDEAFRVWEERSQHQWRLDLSALLLYGVMPPPSPDGDDPSVTVRAITANDIEAWTSAAG